jgi:hypothetical protein
MAESIPESLLLGENSMNRSVAVRALVASAAIAALVATIFILHRNAESPNASSKPGADENAYLSQIHVADAQMSAARNYLGDTIYYLDAKVTNAGSKPVASIELQLEYVDTLGQVVLRDSAFPVTTRMPPLKPGMRRAFQVSYDHMPADWNQAPPKVTVLRVEF